MNRFTQLPAMVKAHFLTVQPDGRKAVCKAGKSVVSQPVYLVEKLDKVTCKNCLRIINSYPK